MTIDLASLQSRDGARRVSPDQWGVADDADCTRVIPNIPEGSSTVAGSPGSCCGFSLARDGRPFSGCTWCRPEDNRGGGSRPSSGGKRSGPGALQTTPVTLERSLAISPSLRRSVPVTLVLDRCRHPAAAMAALPPAESFPDPGVKVTAKAALLRDMFSETDLATKVAPPPEDVLGH